VLRRKISQVLATSGFGRSRAAPRLGHDDAQYVLKRSIAMAWIILVVAGLLETGWAIGLKYTDGFRRPIPSLLTIAGVVVSMYLLSVAARTLPIGTAYAVWVGIGAAGAAVLGIVLLGESANPARLFFVVLLVVAIVGLKFTAG
jgi:quaternary ammonium compound-resistance protein SugE